MLNESFTKFMKTLWSLSDKIFFVKISISCKREVCVIDDVVYYRNALSFDDIFRWFDYFEYLQARVKVANPKRRVLLEIGRLNPDMLLGESFVAQRRATLIKSYHKKLDRVLSSPVVADLFGFAEEDKQQKIADIQTYIGKLEGGEVCFPVIPDYVNNIKNWI